MNTFPIHFSVLLEESVKALCVNNVGTYVDATFGRGGHSKKILETLDAKGKLIALDRDPEAKQFAEQNFGDYSNFVFYQTEMSQLGNVLSELKIDEIDGVLMDIGVSSPQLDEAVRGFSFMKEGPLDMRMDPSKGISATKWVMTTDFDEMVRVFREYGEERFASRIAELIIKERAINPIDTTAKLSKIIDEAIPFKDIHKHPATRCFQAIRITINDELGELRKVLLEGYNALKIGGKMVVISFHSLEDRIVKQFMQERANPPDLFPELPIAVNPITPTLKIMGKPLRASQRECNENIRSRSAIMRTAEKIA